MIDYFAVFTKTGLILWHKTLCKLNGDPLGQLIKEVLMENKAGREQSYTTDHYMLKWSFANDLDLIFVVVYQRLLQPTYIEELLLSVNKDFVNQFRNEIQEQSGARLPFDERFDEILRNVETRALLKKKGRAPKAFQKKSVSTTDKGNSIQENEQTATVDDGVTKLGDGGSKDHELDELLKQRAKRSMQKGKSQRTGGPREKKNASSGAEPRKGKAKRQWDQPGKVTQAAMKQLDYSKTLTKEEEENALQQMRDDYIGEGEDIEDEDEEWSDEDGDTSLASGSESEGFSSGTDSSSGWTFKSTRVGQFFHALSGNKVLREEDLSPALEQMRMQLIGKNVAAEIADELKNSVMASLVGKKLETFTRIDTVVRRSLEETLQRILTPKKSIDVLREVLAANAKGNPYSIIFVGVNGVGKSTNLSKVCYYLKSKGVKVMMAACDTFRSGAVEQLRTHANVLDVHLFEKGYAKDPAAVCREAMVYAKDNNFDCVLVDTAGRMQNNEPLMRALAKLVSSNTPDLVLFVGEAIVGSDGIDQLYMFNRALADYSTVAQPHTIDGIVLTKFDTIDDKVGAAVSLVHKTGQPIVFVGVGQKYTHLKKLNVKTVLKSLL